MVRIKVAPKPYVPTPRNLEVLAARLATGGRQEAADALGISKGVVERHLAMMRAGSGAVDDAMLGWIYRGEIAALIAHPDSE